ncbi:MAG: hypothetical protein DRP45_08885 [Candidatus Zixiibacteriota bacterium]|nr:MAG: hypothetical protein DRP45_08885 [candidate division Zixibacteria bacterium]
MLRQLLAGLLTITIWITVIFIPVGEAGEYDDHAMIPAKDTADCNIGFRVEYAHEYLELWQDAVKRHDDPKANEYEQYLYALINHDIAESESDIRKMAGVFDAEKTSGAGSSVEDSLAFENSLSVLNTKETLYRSLRKSKDSSYKYRLLGDYIQLLRRELKMPKLKLASTERNVTTVYNQESMNE